MHGKEAASRGHVDMTWEDKSRSQIQESDVA